AKAQNAIFNIRISAASWNSNAYDRNTVYYYFFDPANNVAPSFSDLHPMFSNAPGYNNPSFIDIQVSATQQIAFAFQNITGGNTSYSRNGYGGVQGSEHWFYSHYAQTNDADTVHNYTTPNAIAYSSTVTGAGHNGETYTPPSNCSLEVTVGSSTETNATTTPPDAPTMTFDSTHQNSCNDSTSNPNYTNTKSYAAASCSTMNSTTTTTDAFGVQHTTYTYNYIKYNWNDMGGGTDDYDYDDGVYYMSCPSPNNVANVVTLIQ